jgi:predicted enzyme related to lactoylglutathione lyase
MQPDPDAAAAFYGGLFGWELEDAMPAGSGGKYLMARLPGGAVAAVSSPPPGAPPQAVWNTYVWVESADETAATARDAGGTVVTEPFDVVDAGRMAALADPEGATFMVWQARGHRGARIVNEPGALNFNNLNTRDVEGARRFYGAVFGWDVFDLPAGRSWRLPEYGDHLEQLTPGVRKMTADFGVPGFEDVVAAIAPIPADDSDTPAHWSVTFGIDDADAAARRATELGGEVVAGPFDAPFSRQAVLRDPQGATFVVSKFVPESRSPAT